MEVSAFFLADHAEAVNGKLYVVGGAWDRLYTANLPAHHAHLSLSAVIKIPWTATNQRHGIVVDLVDADGHSALPQKMEGDFEAGRPPGMRPGDDSTFVFVANVNGMQLEKEGQYEFVLSIDGAVAGKAPFRLQVLQPAPITLT